MQTKNVRKHCAGRKTNAEAMTESAHFSNPWLQWQRAVIDEAFAAARPDDPTSPRSGTRPTLRKAFLPRKSSMKRIASNPALSERRKPRFRTPLVFVYALVNRPYILDLKKGRSVVAQFRRTTASTPTWSIGACRRTPTVTYPGRLHQRLHGERAWTICRERTGAEQLNVLGYCMGGTMSAMFTALHPERVKNLILMAAPIDFASDDGLLNVWTPPENFDVDKFVDAFGNCPPEFLQSMFLMLRPVGNFIEKPINFYETHARGKFLEDFLTTESWLNDNIPVPGEVYRNSSSTSTSRTFLCRTACRSASTSSTFRISPARC